MKVFILLIGVSLVLQAHAASPRDRLNPFRGDYDVDVASPQGEFVACEDDLVDNPGEHEKARKIIMHFAASGGGLNKSIRRAKSFTKKWMRQYPCSVAAKYAYQFRYIKEFAYSMMGLNMKARKARKFAARMVDRICVKADLYEVYYRAKMEARGIAVRDQEDYAMEILEKEGFSCSILD